MSRSKQSPLARFVGILTDGTDWYLYHPVDDALVEVAHLSLNPAVGGRDQEWAWGPHASVFSWPADGRADLLGRREAR
jgi:hypothetical protein